MCINKIELMFRKALLNPFFPYICLTAVFFNAYRNHNIFLPIRKYAAIFYGRKAFYLKMCFSKVAYLYAALGNLRCICFILSI